MDQDAERDPEDEGEHHHRAHDVVSQELPWKDPHLVTQRSILNIKTMNIILYHDDIPKVLMSNLSMKSHSLSITSCTCFMHFPCLDERDLKKNLKLGDFVLFF